MKEARYDFIVVGAGAAGCVVAARLSENPSTRVLLVEAGGENSSLAIDLPLLTFVATTDPDFNWRFATEPVPELNQRRQVWSQGRGLGGSSSINGMIYTRGHPSEYDGWGAVAGEAWTFAGVQSSFEAIESAMHVRMSELDLPISTAFLAAMGESGFDVVEDLNAGVAEGFGRFACNIHNGRRMSAARAFLDPARIRPNLTIVKHALVTRVLIERDSAVGIVASVDGASRSFYADGEVILCGGAINSPALLMASGIGPAEHLRDVNVPIVVDAPEVGENLSNHPALADNYYCTAPITAFSYMRPLAGLKALADYALRRSGPIAETFTALGGVLKSDPSLEIADAFVVLVPSLLQRSSEADWRALLPKEEGFYVVTALGRPCSRGRIRLRSGSPGDAPLIYPELFADADDIAVLARCVARMRSAIRSPGIAKYIDWERVGQSLGGDSLPEIERSIRERAGALSHPTGACRMGQDARAVVDPALRVNGVSNLRVVDNSIAPQSVNASTHALALMIGEKGAALIRSAH